MLDRMTLLFPRLAASGVLVALVACSAGGPERRSTASDSLHLRVLATHDFHGALRPTTTASSERPLGGVVALKAVMDSLEAACVCPTVRLDGGDQMQGTLESNLTHGASVVAAFNHLGIDAAAVGNHELDWGVDTLLARQDEARYAWLAANVARRTDGQRPDWATPFAIIEREGVTLGVVGYATSSTPRTLRADVGAPYEFGFGYAAIRDALDSVWSKDPDFVVVVAHAAGACAQSGCAGEMVDLASELPPGRVHLIVGGHDHTAGEGVVNSVPIVRAGASGRGIGVIDLHRGVDGSHSFRVSRQPVHADDSRVDAELEAILAPHLRAADEMGRASVTTLTEPLASSAGGDRRLGSLIADVVRRVASADIGLHNPGGVRADLSRGAISYADVHRVLPFDNTVVRLTLSGRELEQVVAHAGPRYYFSNLPAPIVDDRLYTLATNDFLADGGDGFAMLVPLRREAIGITILDAVVDHLRALPAPVTLPRAR